MADGVEDCMDSNVVLLFVTFITALATVVLAIITGYYAFETMRIRKEASRPRLALHTGIYTLDGSVHGLILRNTGPVARNLTVDVQVKDTKGNEHVSIYFPSLNTGEEHYLTHKLHDVELGKGVINVLINCFDSTNHPIKDTLSINFDDLSKQNSKIAFIENPEIAVLEDIKRELSNSINSTLRDIAQKIGKH
jgi:hypothetical protein